MFIGKQIFMNIMSMSSLVEHEIAITVTSNVQLAKFM